MVSQGGGRQEGSGGGELDSFAMADVHRRRQRMREETQSERKNGRWASARVSKSTQAKVGAWTRGGHAAAAHYHGGARWRAAGAPRATRCERSIAAAIQISNTTSNVQLKLHFPPIISPKQIDYLINRLYRYVELRVYYIIA